MQFKARNMTEGNPLRLILSLSLPLMLGNACQQLYTVADTAIVGRALGSNALAALGAVSWFNWMMLSFIQGLSEGFCIRMAQEYGAGNLPGLRKTIGNSCVLSAIAAAILTVAGLLSIRFVLEILETPPEILPLSTRYIRMLFFATPVVMAFNLCSSILRALGDGRTPLLAMLVASGINIGLDLLLVVVFPCGVAGAALATVIAQAFSVLFCLRALAKNRIFLLRKEDFRLERKLDWILIRLGLPVALQNAIISVGGMIVQKVVNGFSVAFIAGYSATNKLYGVLEVAATSFGYSMSTYVGQNLGAREFSRIRSGVRAGVLAALATSAVIGGSMLLFGREILSLFVKVNVEDLREAAQAAQALDVAFEFLSLMSMCLPILYILYVYRSSLQGSGDTLTPMLSGVVEFIMRVSAAIWLSKKIGYSGVFYAEVLAWAGADLILVSMWYVRSWRISRGKSSVILS
ncbi:MAG TPA: MATE family efflux transporter [Candidatus Pullichristensenella excrementigallinarum]|uniref:Probable multidrug resistance protein NorM n=1 Tax=Candidatus Pullichristensenella excrementigallinarum TaxID=2840907 RepID=A0A9D1LBG9_9FIRM|nr:MATE family efflux transporter [Candidatus Pullichristensenella excrementigallinarum]